MRLNWPCRVLYRSNRLTNAGKHYLWKSDDSETVKPHLKITSSQRRKPTASVSKKTSWHLLKEILPQESLVCAHPATTSLQDDASSRFASHQVDWQGQWKCSRVYHMIYTYIYIELYWYIMNSCRILCLFCSTTQETQTPARGGRLVASIHCLEVLCKYEGAPWCSQPVLICNCRVV